MAIIFLAECGTRQQAESFSHHYHAVSWTLKDNNVESKCLVELKQDFEENWWCSLSIDSIDWTPVDRQQANYRHFQILELESFIKAHLKSAPAFRYAFMGEIRERVVHHLLSHASDDYKVTYNSLTSSGYANQFRVPTFVYTLKLGFLLSETLWQQVGSPLKFEALLPGYVWLPPLPNLIFGGIQAPSQKVLNRTAGQIVLDPERSEDYLRRGTELIDQGRFAEGLSSLEKAQKLFPFNLAIHQNKAVALYFLKRFEEALKVCDTAIVFAQKPSDLIVIYQLKGDILYAQGRLDKALESFQNSLNLNPDAAYAVHPHYQKASILKQWGKLQEALDVCEYALTLYPDQTKFHELKSKILASFN